MHKSTWSYLASSYLIGWGHNLLNWGHTVIYLFTWSVCLKTKLWLPVATLM